jgi:type IV secretion system protein VirB8
MKTDPVLGSIQEYIKSGEYFISARKWYKEKYLKPFNLVEADSWS